MFLEQDVVWAEKFRPPSIKDCVLPEYLKKLAENIISSGDLPNLFLFGTPGLGKTTFARALVNDMGLDFLIVRSSMGGSESGMEAIRDNIRKFASVKSLLTDKRKVIIFDEADNLSTSVQMALRNFMDEFSQFTGFIVTCNYPENIDPAILSRFTRLDFDALFQEEKKTLVKESYKAVAKILTNQTIKFEPQVVATLVKASFPDLRNLLCFLEGYHKVHGEINIGALARMKDNDLAVAIEFIKDKRWASLREWAFTQTTVKPQIYSRFFKELVDKLAPQSRPALVAILNVGQNDYSKSADKNMHLLHVLTDVMANVEFS